MSAQFGTFDTLEDRRELVILMQRLGAGVPESVARSLRARWLESLIPQSVSGMAAVPIEVNPDACHPVGAYMLLVQIVGVLGVSVEVAAKQLDAYVSREGWRETGDSATLGREGSSPHTLLLGR